MYNTAQFLTQKDISRLNKSFCSYADLLLLTVQIALYKSMSSSMQTLTAYVGDVQIRIA